MRVLFLGTAGTGKEEVMRAVANIACSEKFKLHGGLEHPDAARHIRIYDLDGRIRDRIGLAVYAVFMDADIREKQKEIWQKELKSILDELHAEKPEHVFLSVHGTYYRYNNFFSIVDMNMLAAFSPDIIITLIDDIYDVSHKITEKEKQYKTNSRCSISEALAWRTVEILMGDFISGHLYIDPDTVGIPLDEIEKLPPNIRKLFRKHIQHFVVAVKHDAKMIYRLLFERKRLVLYSAFPITSTRTDPQKIDKINKFKEKLAEKFTIFDPSTIDEYLLKEKQEPGSEEYGLIKQNNMIEQENDSWILLKRLNGKYSRPTDLPNSLKLDDCVILKDAILKHIVKRDYRIIDQCQGVVAYRPFWGKRPDPSGGVDAELRHALATVKGTFAFHPDEDGDPKTLFTGMENALRYNSEEELINALDQWQADYQKANKDVPDTWES